MHGTWISNDWNQPSDADEESLPTLTISILSWVLEVSNLAMVYHLLYLHYPFDLPLHAWLNWIGKISWDRVGGFAPL